jgi:acetyltransferase
MQAIIAYAKEQGIGELFGAVLPENHAMLDLAERLGFRAERRPEDPEIVEVRLPLGEPV